MESPLICAIDENMIEANEACIIAPADTRKAFVNCEKEMNIMTTNSWGERILSTIDRFDLGKAEMADAIGTSPGNLGSYIGGRVELPTSCKIRLSDMNAYRSKMSILKLTLEEDFDELMSVVVLKEDRDTSKFIQGYIIEDIRAGREREAWIKILDRVKGADSDEQMAKRIGTSRSLISVIRTLEKRLTKKCKMECLKIIKPELTVDELYVLGASLLRQEGLDLLIETEAFRATSVENEKPAAWEL